MIDTHTHLFDEQFDADRPLLMRKAAAAGVTAFLLPNIDEGTVERMLATEKEFPGRCFALMGVHPCHVNGAVDNALAHVRQWLERRPFAGIGEIGMDMYWDKTFAKQQEKAFETQLAWAVEFNLAVSIHCRAAFEQMLDVLKRQTVLPRGVFHCFSGSAAEAAQLLQLGDFCLGIGGVVTFKNGGLDKALVDVPLERMVLETDAPYLAPVPFRGKRNEPAYLSEIARKLAEIKGRTFAEVAGVTSANAMRLFPALDKGGNQA